MFHPLNLMKNLGYHNETNSLEACRRSVKIDRLYYNTYIKPKLSSTMTDVVFKCNYDSVLPIKEVDQSTQSKTVVQTAVSMSDPELKAVRKQ